MSKYDSEYYFVMSDDSDSSLPYLLPDTNTNERRFRVQAQPVGSAPLVFSNGLKEDYKTQGRREHIADILFHSSTFAVRDKIREELITYDIPDIHIHPAIYIDDTGVWHEDYWFLTFTNAYDCWDRDNSTFDPEPLDAPKQPLFSVFSYSLNTEFLDNIPLNRRLLFKMGGVIPSVIVCHQSIASLFRKNRPNGAKLVAINDY